MTAVDPGSDLHLNATYLGERALVVAQGNLDVYTAPLLRAQLVDAVDAGARRITLIVRGVNLIDSSGLSSLVFGYKLATGRGGDFTLYGDEVLVARLLARTGLDRVIPLHHDLDRGGGGEFRATGS